MLVDKAVHRVIWFCIVAVLSVNAFAVYAKDPVIAVLYPDLREPYKRIFEDILEGIRGDATGDVTVYAVKKGEAPDEALNWLDGVDPELVISLGSSRKVFAGGVPDGLKVVTGATILSNKNIEQGTIGISLSPSPRKLFTTLGELAPEVKRVTVIFHQPSNGWLVTLAQKEAAKLGLEFNAVPAADVRQAATLYKELFSKVENGNDALWLLQGDPTLDERGLLPTILSQAWKKHTIVFSSNPVHVKRGVLFSLFPDNKNMGSSLVAKAHSVIKGESTHAEPLEDLLIAVNVRTAKHLNLKVSRSMERGFDMIFPSR